MPTSSSTAIARPLRPTDLPALVSFWARSRPPLARNGARYRNEARTWERLGIEEQGFHLLDSTIEQWLPLAGRRHTWIAVRGLNVRGLASARWRGARRAWEVDYFVAPSADTSVCLSLLEQLARSLGGAGVEKVFLRLDADSGLLAVVREAGFFPYLGERLLRIDGAPPGLGPSNLPLRQRRISADILPLFQLYNASVPATVRRHEGVTLREWLAAQEKGRCQHLVLQDDPTGRVTAWLRIAKSERGSRFSLLSERREAVPLDHLLAAALSYLADKRPIFCLVPEYQRTLARHLGEMGFRPAAEYVVLVNRLVRPVEEAVPVPEAARQPYPVS